MTRFLASLVARSTGQERVLKPRRLLFEPGDEPAIDADADPGAAVEPAADRSRPPAPPAPPARAQSQPTAPAKAPPAAQTEHLGEKPPAATPTSRQRRAPSRRSADPVRADEQVDPGRDMRPARRKPRPAPREETPASHPARVARPAAPRPVTAEPAERGSVARRQRLRSPPAAREGSSEGPQMVRIAIGRVDVRAVQAPAEQATPAGPAPPRRMTLEEYLAREPRR